MNRLGLRLALAGGRRALAITAFGIALGTAVLLLALTIDPAIHARAERLAWREPSALTFDEATAQTRFTLWSDAYRGRPLLRVLVAGTDAGAPIPPGIPSLPRPGSAYLSPALAALVGDVPGPELGDRLGAIAGEIGDEALADPGELVAIIGVTPADLPHAVGVTSFEAIGDIPTPQGFLRIALAIGIVGLLAPIGIFVATATRLSAARRAEKFAAIRLAGASPGQARRLAAVEALVAGGGGAVGGIIGFFLLRPAAALLPFDGHAWFIDDLTPDLAWAAAVVGLVPLVSVAAALIALNGALSSPLGTLRRSAPTPVSALRLVPLVGATALLAAAISWDGRGGSGDPNAQLVLVGVAFLLLVGGLVWAGPYLVSVVAGLLRRVARQPATLIAARRLEADPRGGFYAISGVVLAVFIGSLFHALQGPSQSSVDLVAGNGLRASTVSAVTTARFQVGAERIEALTGALEAIDGVERVVLERDVELLLGGEYPVRALVMSCDDARAVLHFPVAECGTADLLTPREVDAAAALGTHELAADGIQLGSTWNGTLTLDRIASMTVPWGVDFPGLLDPAAVDGDLAGVAPSRILVATDGQPAAIERVRTTIEAALPTTRVLGGRDEARLRNALVDEIGWLISFGLAAVMLVAASSLAMSVIGGLIERRRPLGLLRLSGMPPGQLQRLVLIEASGPLVLASLATSLAGIGVAQLIARIGGAADPGLPGPSILIPVGIGIGGSLLVVLAVLPFLEAATRSDATRFE